MENSVTKDGENVFGSAEPKILPYFKRKASENYNYSTHSVRRLSKNLLHERVMATPTRGVLIIWAKRGTKRGGPKLFVRDLVKYSRAQNVDKLYAVNVGQNRTQGRL